MSRAGGAEKNFATGEDALNNYQRLGVAICYENYRYIEDSYPKYMSLFKTKARRKLTSGESKSYLLVRKELEECISFFLTDEHLIYCKVDGKIIVEQALKKGKRENEF